MEAPIVKDGGSNYQRWRLQIWGLQIVNNLESPYLKPHPSLIIGGLVAKLLAI